MATAERFAYDVEVERVAVTFAGLRSGTSGSLVGHTAGASIVITGRGHLPRRLPRVSDPDYELVGR